MSTKEHLPVILVRGFGGLGVADERRIAYQGFNDGTVYPGKRGENYIYEGLVLKFLKSDYTYHDATNVVGYYASPVEDERELPAKLVELGISPDFFTGSTVIDPAMALALVQKPEEIRRTLWVFRYYDLERKFGVYAEALVRLIDFIQALARTQDEAPPKVNIIAHSMGGLIVREAVQMAYPRLKGTERAAEDYINKIVTLGTPHRGISFQVLSNWVGFDADEELERFNPDNQKDEAWEGSYKNFDNHFALDRLLTVVGTNYRSYGNKIASGLNRIFSVGGEFGPLYNRSDGLVKQTLAQIPGAPRTFVNKCHGGEDSLVTSREAYEIATRFFFGDVHLWLKLVDARIKHGNDLFGGSEFFLGVSIKARDVDFELFHQSRDAENCYGPYKKVTLDDDLAAKGEKAFPPLADGVLWEGWVDRSSVREGSNDLVFRLELYVAERDSFGVHFSDDVITHRQVFLRAAPPEGRSIQDAVHDLYYSDDRRITTDPQVGVKAEPWTEGTRPGWTFTLEDPNFIGTFAVEFEVVQ
jgi:hypothetical protein